MEAMSLFPPRLAPLLDASSPVQQLARLLADAGHECYLVGGSVRDAFLDRTLRDGEVPTSTSPPTRAPTSSSVLVRPWADAVWLQGQRFGTVGCRKDDAVLEITTFRAEVYRPESRKPEVVFSDDIETDLSRRDFTVNAMALRLPDPVLVDPFDGVGRPRGAPPAHAARARGLVPRRPAAHAPCRRASSRSSASSPIPSSSPRWSSCATGSRS